MINFNKTVLALCLTSLLTACGAGSSTEATAPRTVPAKAAVADIVADARQEGVQNVSNAELKTLMDQGVTLIDIRLPEEWTETGVVKGSKLLTFFNSDGSVNPDFVKQATAIAPQGGEVALICRTGNRTQAAADMLIKAGIYKRVYNVTHGITTWVGEGQQVSQVN